jgi:ATP-dependent exoDNAse (exonuclease V) beta subunit
LEKKSLTLYKASAGSGKTFRLTQHYLSLALASDKNYTRILAITFTRKATAEMRQRIVAELKVLSATPEKSQHAKTLADELNIGLPELQLRAQKLLPAILHDYSNFSITTIDQFFQRIIRSLTRELGLAGGFRIEMDEIKILSRAVDMMLDKSATHEPLFDLVTEYIRNEVITENKSHQIHKSIVSFVRKMLREDLKNTFIKLGDENFDAQILALQKEMSLKVKAFESQIQQRVLRFDTKLSENDFTLENLSARSNARKFYNRAKSKDYKDADLANFFSADFAEDKGAPSFFTVDFVKKNKNLPLDSIASELFSIFEDDLRFFIEGYPEYFLSKNARSRLWFLRFFGYIWREMNAIKLDEGLFVIGDAPVLLAQIAEQTDTPFIFERIANYYSHFMIDEFQDTSTLQWQNLRPFLENSMAQFSPGIQKSLVNNLIVGDVKQAIYRFRNGNWTLLNEKVGQELGHLGIASEVLNTNWRSEKTIIEFNNLLFKILPENLPLEHFSQMPAEYRQYLTSIYKDNQQNISPFKKSDNGFVRFETVPDEEYAKETVSRVCKQIFELLNNDISQGDIAILVRTADQGRLIATQLLAFDPKETGHTLQISMSDVLSIDKSIAVQAIIQTLYYLSNPGERFYLWMATWHVNQVLENSVDDFFMNGPENILPLDFFTQNDNIQRLTIYDTVIRLIDIFRLNQNQSEIPFLSRLLNLIISYQQNNPPDRNSFLKYWEEEGPKVKIPAPATTNAIQIMTMHKSKGLEFEHVIIPFVDWPIVHRGSNDIWINNKLGKEEISIPVPFNKGAEYSTYPQQLYSEYFDMVVDSLNILYVAFTRAVRSLTVFYPQKQEKGTVCLWLNNAFLASEMWPGQKELDSNGQLSGYKCGNQTFSAGKEQSKPGEQHIVCELVVNTGSTVAVRASGRPYPKTGDSEMSGIEYGTIMHRVMEQITTTSSLDSAMKNVAGSGLLQSHEVEAVHQRIKNWISQPDVHEWFAESSKIYNEQVILSPDGKLRRPDRIVETADGRWIVIDYKFTHDHLPEHEEQVRHYVRMLEKAGKRVDSAFLWYMVGEGVVQVH